MIELDIFSGRSNPQWQADPASQRLLSSLESTLRPTREAQPEPPALGYRGFVFASDGIPCRAFAGLIQCGDVVLADPEMSVERALAAALPEEYAPLRARVIAALTGPG